MATCISYALAMQTRVWLAACLAAAACNGSKPTPKPTNSDQPAPPSSDATPGPVRATSADAGAAAAKPTANAAPASWGPVSTKVGQPPAAVAARVKLVKIADGLKRPVALEVAPGDASGRLFVVEQHVARIRILRNGKVEPKPFLDLGRVSLGNEQGLLGLAFHPKFASNRKLYINYTDTKGVTRVVEYRVSKTDPNQVDKTTAREVFSLKQPWSNHNAGDLEFGPDGKLYIGTGDGGAANDMLGAGQDPKKLLAKMLRLDVDTAGSKPVVVALGLRNPWRYQFDPKTGNLYIGDVGQNLWEEIDVIGFSALKPLPASPNFGWNTMEGTHCFRSRRCNRKGLIAPAIDYDRTKGCSVTGGEVYRGKAIPELDAVYFYADYCTGLLRSFRWSSKGVHQHWDWRKTLDPNKRVQQISSFGHDHAGELYILSLEGPIYKLVRK